ncbi:hypothetical protein Aph01nite_51660 [Acrocarpospora phusangensis]|uniref:Uncharacterized protein n=1 Tax=Acrocarpospora phusangensis TaxID=1070424 RepID=A0A919QFA9_9ACTN|nr:hypothetical protein Aph01nite_51660 [Acrocarpospora phusangensis]
MRTYVPRDPEAPTVERPMCVFRAPGGGHVLIGAATLASPRATLAAVAYVHSPPPPRVDSAINPDIGYCLALGGKSDPAGWYPIDDADARPIPFCVFADDSVIDTWGLASRAVSPARAPDLRAKFRYRAPSPSPVHSVSGRALDGWTRFGSPGIFG